MRGESSRVDGALQFRGGRVRSTSVVRAENQPHGVKVDIRFMGRQEQEQPWWERPARSPGEPRYVRERERLRAELARAWRADGAGPRNRSVGGRFESRSATCSRVAAAYARQVQPGKRDARPRRVRRPERHRHAQREMPPKVLEQPDAEWLRRRSSRRCVWGSTPAAGLRHAIK